jgi:hypothetical protein
MAAFSPSLPTGAWSKLRCNELTTHYQRLYNLPGPLFVARAQIAGFYPEQYAGLRLCPRLTRHVLILLSCNLGLYITDLISRVLVDMHNNRS